MTSPSCTRTSPHEGAPIPPVYDLQRLFGDITGDTKNRAGLKKAMKALGIQPTVEHPFHSAVDDAYYTALVFQRFPDPQAITGYPQSIRSIGRVRSREHETIDTWSPPWPRRSAFSSKNCPLAKAAIPEGYVALSSVGHGPRRLSDHARCLSTCTLKRTPRAIPGEAPRCFQRAEPRLIKNQTCRGKKVAAARQKEVSA